ncbi:PIN domain-containing protein [Pseudomonas monteilii]|uniref:PIN domain-containing protein n=1 Tax=Pseudomonas monteilii TaxID=76759 RepID=UPI0013305FCA|nr:PIN domain-containing protein [Pseudomonas monteilii]
MSAKNTSLSTTRHFDAGRRFLDIRNIVVDTNFLVKDYNLNSHDTAKLIKIKDYYKLKLILPEIVYDECLSNYKKHSNEAHAAIVANIEKYKKILVNIKKTEFDHDELMTGLADLSKYYKPKLDGFITNNEIEKISYPSICHRTVVKKMYDGTPPFRPDKTEVGYKDFLIIESIREHLDPQDITVVLSKNVKDFCGPSSLIGKRELIPVSESLDMKSVYVIETIDALSSVLSQNMKLTSSDSPWNYVEIENFLITSIDSGFYNSEIYGSFFITPTSTKDIIISIKELDTQQADIESGYLEIIGLAQIQMNCSFDINSFMFNTSDTEFVFHDAVVAAMKSLNYTDEDFWEIKFHDFNFCRNFEFSITDYDYQAGKKLEESFLTLERIES